MKPFEAQLVVNIKTKIKSLRRIGTVAMGIDNLKQVTPTPSHLLEGAPQGGNLEWQYAQLFRNVCESNPAISRFLIR